MRRELRRSGRTLDAIWTAIRSAGSHWRLPAEPGPSCAWCGYKSFRPAWDGCPRPTPAGPPADPRSA